MSLNLNSERDARPGHSNRLHWEMFALWIVVAISFAGMFAAGYIIWAKCQGK